MPPWLISKALPPNDSQTVYPDVLHRGRLPAGLFTPTFSGCAGLPRYAGFAVCWLAFAAFNGTGLPTILLGRSCFTNRTFP